jgi:hypothetical protein
MPCHKAGHLICIKMLKFRSDDVHCQHEERAHERKDHCQVLPSCNNRIDEQDSENKK